jgi:hypothetical protein
MEEETSSGQACLDCNMCKSTQANQLSTSEEKKMIVESKSSEIFELDNDLHVKTLTS